MVMLQKSNVENEVVSMQDVSVDALLNTFTTEIEVFNDTGIVCNDHKLQPILTIQMILAGRDCQGLCNPHR